MVNMEQLFFKHDNNITWLLSRVLPEEYHETWLAGFNKDFGDTPQNLVDKGQEDMVISYLRSWAFGPI